MSTVYCRKCGEQITTKRLVFEERQKDVVEQYVMTRAGFCLNEDCSFAHLLQVGLEAPAKIEPKQEV